MRPSYKFDDAQLSDLYWNTFRRIIFNQNIEQSNCVESPFRTLGDRWADTREALQAIDSTSISVGTGWQTHVDRYTDIGDQIDECSAALSRLIDLRDTIENLSSRAYERTLTEYYLGAAFGFDESPFVILAVLCERLCDEFDQAVLPAANLLEKELCDADDEVANWWDPVNAAAMRATKATHAWLTNVQLLRYRLRKAADQDLRFF